MAKDTTSLNFPNMIDVTRSCVSIKEGDASVVNRVRLLILTDPTELYNSPSFGVGLRRYLWQYNTSNTKAIIQDRIRDQLREWEPCVDAESTQFADGLLFTGDDESRKTMIEANRLKFTVGLRTIYGTDISVDIDLSDESMALEE